MEGDACDVMSGKKREDGGRSGVHVVQEDGSSTEHLDGAAQDVHCRKDVAYRVAHGGGPNDADVDEGYVHATSKPIATAEVAGKRPHKGRKFLGKMRNSLRGVAAKIKAPEEETKSKQATD